MALDQVIHKLAVLAGAVMIAGGLALGIWSITHMPGMQEDVSVAARAQISPLAPASATTAVAGISRGSGDQNALAQRISPLPTAGTVRSPSVGLSSALPEDFRSVVTELAGETIGISVTLVSSGTINADDFGIWLDFDPDGGVPVYDQYYVAAARFDTVDLTLSASEIRQTWQADSDEVPVVVLSDTLPALNALLGVPGASVQPAATVDELITAVWQEPGTLALLPFDELKPQLAAYAVDDQIPVENSLHFDPAAYPLVVTVYAHVDRLSDGAIVDQFLASLPPSNRLAERLTVVAMTGVTAMVRLTAAQMDRYGPEWPADIVGPELAGADITHISNEVPFVAGCETNTDLDNLVFCSPPTYTATLHASGADIIGLTGNHQNDYGRTNALASLDLYEELDLPVYGGGATLDAARAPLFFEHNGNRLAFIGANSFGPPSAWATEFTPGSAPFDLAVMSAAVRSIKQEREADVVLTELQYQESYGTEPLFEQRQDFTALVRAGADIVTGVQSHVPQGIQFIEEGMILYGLGNLYFDQMWSEETRQGLIVKHTIYDGRHISTRLLPTILYDYGQPHWADEDEREMILERVFAASYWP